MTTEIQSFFKPLQGYTLAALLLCGGVSFAEPQTPAKSHFLIAADTRNASATARMTHARNLLGAARDLTTLPVEASARHQANLREAANTAIASARQGAKAVVNYDTASKILTELARHLESEQKHGAVQEDVYRERAKEMKEKALHSSIFVAEAYEWAADLYAQDYLDLDKHADAMEKAAAWRESIANRILNN